MVRRRGKQWKGSAIRRHPTLVPLCLTDGFPGTASMTKWSLAMAVDVTGDVQAAVFGERSQVGIG